MGKEVFMFRKKVKKGYVVYENENGPVIGSTKDQILVKDGCVFKDLAGTGNFFLMRTGDWAMKKGQKTWLPDFL